MIFRSEWERHTSRQQDIPSTAEVIEFLEDKCKALELLQASQSTGTTPTRYAQQTGTKVSQSKCNLTTQVQCPSCKEPHRLFRCNNFLRMQPKQCFEFAKQVRGCFNCLQPYTRNHTCSQGTCHECRQCRHTLLHGPNKVKQLGTRSILLSVTTLQMPGAIPLQQLTHIVHLKASPQTKYCLQLQLLK